MGVPLNIDVAGLRLNNPVILASGCAGYGVEWSGLINPEDYGGIVLKGISFKPWLGNPPRRIGEVTAGLVNSIGLENVGLEVFLREKLPALPRDYPAKVIANVLGASVSEYAKICLALDKEWRVDALELNVSCPNVKEGGLAFGADAAELRFLVRNCRKATEKPLWVKLPPLVTDIVPLAKAALAGGADVLVVANTIPAMAMDVTARRPLLGNTYGGLSGPAVRPIILRLVHRIFEATGAPIIASGGVDSPEAAAAYLLAGARAVEIGTALFTDPKTPGKVCKGLSDWLEREAFPDVNTAVRAILES